MILLPSAKIYELLLNSPLDADLGCCRLLILLILLEKYSDSPMFWSHCLTLLKYVITYVI